MVQKSWPAIISERCLALEVNGFQPVHTVVRFFFFADFVQPRLLESRNPSDGGPLTTHETIGMVPAPTAPDRALVTSTSGRLVFFFEKGRLAFC